MRESIGRACAVLSCTMLLGCTPADRSAPGPVTLDGAVLAVQFSTTGDEGRPDGALVVVSGDGSLRTQKIGQMDQAQPVWGAQGIVFADEEGWYRLADTLERHPAALKSEQLGGTLGPDGTARLVFNEGFAGPRRYASWQVSVLPDGSGKAEPFPGLVGSFAACRGFLAVVGSNDDRIAPTDPDVTLVQSAEALYTLDDRHGLSVVSTRAAQPHANVMSAAPCTSAGLSVLQTGGDADPSPYLLSWPFKGSSTKVRVNSVQGWTPAAASVQPQLVRGKMRTCQRDGLCVDIDLRTAQATVASTADDRFKETWISYVSTAEQTYAVTVAANQDGDGLLWLLEDERRGWREVMRIPHLADHRGPLNMVMRGFAMKPGWTPPVGG